MKLENPAALVRPTITIPPPPKEEPVHPFVRAMAAMGEAIGRDAGILALAAVQNTKNGIDAVLYWDGANAPDAIATTVRHCARDRIANPARRQPTVRHRSCMKHVLGSVGPDRCVAGLSG